jgi:hypothetical protein
VVALKQTVTVSLTFKARDIGAFTVRALRTVGPAKSLQVLSSLNRIDEARCKNVVHEEGLAALYLLCQVYNCPALAIWFAM